MKIYNGEDAFFYGEQILSSEGLLAKHGTNLNRLDGIFTGGLRINEDNKTVREIFPDETVFELFGYAFRTSLPETAACVILDIPKEILKNYEGDIQSKIFKYAIKDEVGNSVIPSYFIRGAARLKNRKQIWESSNNIDDLEFIENPNYINALTEQERFELLKRYNMEEDDTYGKSV